jgi:hypothetical protein
MYSMHRKHFCSFAKPFDSDRLGVFQISGDRVPRISTSRLPCAKGEQMKDEEVKAAAPPPETQKPAPIWGGFIVDILQKLLEFNQLPYGIKKKF